MKTQRVYKIDGVRITVKELADAVWEYGQYLKGFSKEELTERGSDFCGSEIRLQVLGGHWLLHKGDSQYDQDHRGYWASNAVSRGINGTNARNVAIELLEELEEDVAATGC